jgi:hypothetical protein
VAVTPSEVAQEESTAAALEISVTPASGKTGVPVSAEIGVKVAGGTVRSVTLRDGNGKAVPGEMRADGSAFVPAKPLKTKQRYEATVVAADAGGTTSTATTSFTTMGKPGRKTGTGLYLFDDHTYGVAMPVVAEFSPGIKQKDRAAVQRRMFVKTDPPQPGTWSWTSSGLLPRAGVLEAGHAPDRAARAGGRADRRRAARGSRPLGVGRDRSQL